MMKQTRCILLGLSLLFMACGEKELTLVKNSKSDYTIVLPANHDSLELTSAQALQEYIKKISGVAIPIQGQNNNVNTPKIHIGKQTTAQPYELKKDEILIKTDKRDLILAGGCAQSTLYAGYHFLEKYLGVRFYTPEVEMIPSADQIVIPVDTEYRYLPDITTRTVHSRLFYDNPAFADKRKTTHEAFPDYVPSARVHTFHRFLPADLYYTSHPEYYALRNGKRVTTQLCLTNEEVLDIVIEVVDSLIEKYPDSRVISVSQDDNQQYCQCHDCDAVHQEEGSASGSMIRFVNKVASRFPDKVISTLAYQYTRKAPLVTKPLANVLITLCSIECDRSAPIDENCKKFTEDLIAWGKLTDNIRIWDYTTQFTNFLAPFPNIQTLQPNIRLFRDNNAKWIFEQHSMHPSELFEYRSYLTAKLLWNPDLNQEAVMEDFLTGYYQEAAPYIKDYISSIHGGIKQDSNFFLFLYGDPSQAFGSFLHPNKLIQYDQWYNQAIMAVEDKPEVVKRVNGARLSIDYAILEAARQNNPDGFAIVRTNNESKKYVDENIIERLERFENTCNEGKITLMNEMRYSVSEYIELYRRTIAKALEDNIARGAEVSLAKPPKKYANEDPKVLTDGAFGGASFYSNWLGFEENDMEAVIDLGSKQTIEHVSCDFLQVVNHIVFFPQEVNFYISPDGAKFRYLGSCKNKNPLSKGSKINDIQKYDIDFTPANARYIKVVARNYDEAPAWHHGSGLPTWIFADEIIVH